VPAEAWLFVVLAVAVGALRLSRVTLLSLDPVDALAIALWLIRVVAWVLLPAALFLRHLVGWDTAPSPPPALGDVIGLTGAIGKLFAIGYRWIGFRAVRRQPDPEGTRGMLVLMTAAALVAILIGAAGLALAGTAYVDTLSVAVNAFSAIVSALTLLAWVAVASVLIAGARAGETRLAPWRLGAWGVAVGSVLPGGIGWLLTVFGSLFAEVSPAVVWLYTAALAVGALLLLAAFAMGLPEGEAG